MPNIWGYHGAWNYNVSGGAFYGRNDLSENIKSGNHSTQGLGFDASRCSPIYGRSNTVTPETYVIAWLMKVPKLSEDKCNITVNQVYDYGQILTVSYEGKNYTSSFNMDKNKPITVSISPKSNYSAGKIIIGDTEYNQTSITMTPTKDLIISASEPTQIMVNVVIVQSNHQTITVTADGTDYTSDFKVPNGTSYTVSISADDGYEAGELNVESGIFTKDISISATPATSITNKYIITLSSTENQTVYLVHNNNMYASDIEDEVEIEVSDGDKYNLFVIPDDGYTAGVLSEYRGIVDGDINITCTLAKENN